MASLKTRGFIALDEMEPYDALFLAARMRGLVYGIKIEDLLAGSMSNMELICRLKEMGFKVFADAKVHKTPPAAASYVKRLAHCGADLITVHGSGGREMVKACVDAYGAVGVRDARTTEPGMGILAITVLTSLSGEACKEMYARQTIRQTVIAHAEEACAGNAFGLVSSPREVQALKRQFGRMKRVTPGIKLPGSSKGRHARSATPEVALTNGADWLVIGSEVTKAADPLQVIEAIEQRIAHLP